MCCTPLDAVCCRLHTLLSCCNGAATPSVRVARAPSTQQRANTTSAPGMHADAVMGLTCIPLLPAAAVAGHVPDDDAGAPSPLQQLQRALLPGWHASLRMVGFARQHVRDCCAAAVALHALHGPCLAALRDSPLLNVRTLERHTTPKKPRIKPARHSGGCRWSSPSACLQQPLTSGAPRCWAPQLRIQRRICWVPPGSPARAACCHWVQGRCRQGPLWPSVVRSCVKWRTVGNAPHWNLCASVPGQDGVLTRGVVLGQHVKQRLCFSVGHSMLLDLLMPVRMGVYVYGTCQHCSQSSSLGDRWPWDVPLQQRAVPSTSLLRILDAAPLSDVTNRDTRTDSVWQVHTRRGAVLPGPGFARVCSIRYLMLDAVVLAHLAAEPGILLSLRDGACISRNCLWTMQSPHFIAGTFPGPCVMAIARGWPLATLAGRLGCTEEEAGRLLQGVVDRHPGVGVLQARCPGGDVVSLAGRRLRGASVVRGGALPWLG